MDLNDRVIDVHEHEVLRPKAAEQRGPGPQIRHEAGGDSVNWRTCPNVKARRNEPSVEGA